MRGKGIEMGEKLNLIKKFLVALVIAVIAIGAIAVGVVAIGDYVSSLPVPPKIAYAFVVPQKYDADYFQYNLVIWKEDAFLGFFGNTVNATINSSDYFTFPYQINGEATANSTILLTVRYYNSIDLEINGTNIQSIPKYILLGEETDYRFKVTEKGE